MDKTKYQVEGLKWLQELELLNHPQAVNTIKFNILVVSKSIKEVELLIYRENKTMLVLLELSWFGRKFNKKDIFSDVQESLTQLLPSFRFRVTDDPRIMELAMERVKKALTGGTNENASNSSINPNDKLNNQSNTATSSVSNNTGSSESLGTSQEEQSDNVQAVLDSLSKNDSGEGQKA